MIHTYVSSRAIKRRTANDLTRHAVDELSHLCGALDTRCGRKVAVELGPWDPTHPRSCRACIEDLAEQSDQAS